MRHTYVWYVQMDIQALRLPTFVVLRSPVVHLYDIGAVRKTDYLSAVHRPNLAEEPVRRDERLISIV